MATRVCLWTGHAAIGEGADETWPPELDAARAITAVGDGEEMSHTVAREREREGWDFESPKDTRSIHSR